MSNANIVLQEIYSMTEKLISINLSVSQNYPSSISTSDYGVQITFSGASNLSVALKNIEYHEIYRQLDRSNNYNLKLIDGALIQLSYTFSSEKLVSHRLCFFPSPSFEPFQNEPEIYELDEIYADVIAKNILPVPIRFDFDPSNFCEYDHPQSHLTLGQYKNCRIPVSSAISPSVFIVFILRSFYNTAYKKFENLFQKAPILFDESITPNEKKHLHISIAK
jgi:hypothetical protein